jgi:hypothetical protein
VTRKKGFFYWLPLPMIIAVGIGLTVWLAWPPAYKWLGPWTWGRDQQYAGHDVVFALGILVLFFLLAQVFPKRLGGRR